jgi:hypothetical protein
MLAQRMLAQLPHIDVIGMAVGNGCWGNAVGLCSDSGDSMTIVTQFFHSHEMFDDALWEEMQTHCDWYNVTSACAARVHKMRGQMGTFNLYNVYDNCGMDLVRVLQLQISCNRWNCKPPGPQSIDTVQCCM